MSIYKELEKQRAKNDETQQAKLLKEAYEILKGTAIYGNSYNENNSKSVVSSKTDLLNKKKIFEEEHIKSICIQYGLRFIDSKYYKADLPHNVHLSCSALEIMLDKSLEFKILTKPSNFKTKHPNGQHFVFAKLNKNEYYLVNQWGSEISKLRKYFNLPFRNIDFLMVSTILVSLFISIITPSRFISSYYQNHYFTFIRASFFFWTLILLSAIIVYYIVAIRKGLNNHHWDNSVHL